MKKIALIAVLSGLILSAELLFSQSKSEKKIADAVSQARLLQTVRDLVKLGNRVGGTKSGDRAAQYVQKKFEVYGLPVTQNQDPNRLTYSNRGWELDIVEPRSLRGIFRNQWLSGFSPTVNSRTARLVLFDAEHKDGSGATESTAVIVPHAISNEVYRNLVDAGAGCILSYFANESGSYKSGAFINDLSASRANPIPVFNISVGNGERLSRELKSGRKITVKFSTKTEIFEGNPKTVVATLEGLSDDYFLVCAHGDSDSGGPGADDNASGVAGVLEIARILNSLIVSQSIPKPKKSIRFAVWGSEYFSSEAYVRKNEKELSKILGVLNFDEIGTGKTRNCLYFEGNDNPVNENLLRVLEKVGVDYSRKKGFWDESTTNPSQGGTDSYVFLPDYMNKLSLSAEIPSVTIFTAAWNVPKVLVQTRGWTSSAWRGHPDSVNVDFSPYYHSSIDVPETTTEKEPFNMVWAAKAVAIGLLRLAW